MNCPRCATAIPEGVAFCGQCGSPLTAGATGGTVQPPAGGPGAPDAENIRGAIRRNNLLSFALGIPAILMIIGGMSMASKVDADGSFRELGVNLRNVGSGLLVAGMAFYARTKGRGWPWGILGIFSLLGLIGLALMNKYCQHCKTPASFSVKQCAKCGAPM